MSPTHPIPIPGLRPTLDGTVRRRPPPGPALERPWTRRDFVKAGMGSLAVTVVGPWSVPGAEPAVVSMVSTGNGGIPRAVEEAIDLLGGIEHVMAGKERILLKPNLVAESPAITTKPEVVRTLAALLKAAGKEVLIGEGSAAGNGFNLRDGVQYRTKNREILDAMQQYVFDQLGYTELAGSLHVPLLNLHSGDLVEVDVPDGQLFERITLHRSLTDIDALVSVPMMKTHVLATVTLGLKNLIGLYPGTIYYSVRAWLHDHAAAGHSPGTAFEILDMARANKLGLTVIDASQAMEGDGPSAGDIVDMGLIIAGTNPLATDMVGAAAMGIPLHDVPTFTVAWESGMTPTRLEDIEIRGVALDQARKDFKRPAVIPWTDIAGVYGVQEIRQSAPH